MPWKLLVNRKRLWPQNSSTDLTPEDQGTDSSFAPPVKWASQRRRHKNNLIGRGPCRKPWARGGALMLSWSFCMLISWAKPKPLAKLLRQVMISTAKARQALQELKVCSASSHERAIWTLGKLQKLLGKKRCDKINGSINRWEPRSRASFPAYPSPGSWFSLSHQSHTSEYYFGALQPPKLTARVCSPIATLGFSLPESIFIASKSLLSLSISQTAARDSCQQLCSIHGNTNLSGACNTW